MRILIVEDENAAARRLEKMLLELEPSATVLDKLDSVEAAVLWLRHNPQPDLILLDIHLADGSSFEIFEHVAISCPVIFTTAYDEYALQAFKLTAVDYLLKPIKTNELEAALSKYKRLFKPAPGAMSELLEHMRRPGEAGGGPYLRRMLIRFGSSYKLVDTEDAAYFYSKDKITFVVTRSSAKRFPVDYPLDKLEHMLDPAQFFRINRQFIVQVPAIKDMQAHSKSRVKLTLEPAAEAETVVSTERAAAFKKWLVGKQA
jgi:two-component system LytT family response regulator